LLILLEIFRDYVGRYGEHYFKFSLQPNEYKKCHCVLPNNCSHLTFLKKSCSLGLVRWFATNFTTQSFWSICTRFSGLVCLDMKNICGKFHCKVSCWRLYTSIRTRHIQLNDAYMRHSTPCAFERMMHMCIIQQRRC